jgi:MFS transporter, ceroid-lipofuscinosis neuronal protein 7
MTLICLITIALILFLFKDRHRIVTVKDKERMNAKQSAVAEVAMTQIFMGFTIYDCCIMGCMLLNISTKGSIASFETLGISYADTHFQMDSSKAGTIVASCGSVGVVALLLMGKFATVLTDIQLICGGMIIMCCGIVSLTSLEEGADNSTWRYVFAIFMMYSIGYPIGHTAVIGIFSKIVGRRPQGVLMGWFASAGSLARMIFPIMSGYMANYMDVSILFWLLTFILALSTIFVLVSRSTLNVLSS